jgi:hypothetical protein
MTAASLLPYGLGCLFVVTFLRVTYYIADPYWNFLDKKSAKPTRVVVSGRW